MNVLHIFPSFAVGGIETRTCHLINGMPAHVRHSIVALDGDTSCRTRLAADRQVRFLTPPAISGGLWRRLRAIAGILKEQQPDLLITHNWGAIEWAAANRLWGGLRHVHQESGFSQQEARRQLLRRRLFRRFALQRAEALVVPSLSLLVAAASWGMAQRTVRIPDGIPLDPFRTRADQMASPLKLVTVARFRAEKNLHRLPAMLQASRHLTHVAVDLWGSGPEEPQISRAIDQADMTAHIHLRGFTGEPERVLPEAQIFLLPSLSEQFPNTVLQAMAAGLVVVGYDVGDVIHMLPSENRPFIAPVGDEAAFVRALEVLQGDPALRQRIADANVAHVRANYDVAAMIAAYERLWRISGGPGSAA